MRRITLDDRLFNIAITCFMIVLGLITAYPLIYIVSASFSSPQAVSAGKVVLWPVDISIEGYRAVFRDPNLLIGYRNTIFYTIAGTFINVSMTMAAAYPLSRRELVGRGIFLFLFSFTMLFNGGLIPNYMLMNNLGLINTVWAMLLPGAISIYNLFITRTFINSSIPYELWEASQIDGCSDFRYFFAILLPLSKPVIAVIALYYAVGHWNDYFNAFIYLTDRALFPLQLILRDILISNKINSSMIVDPELLEVQEGMADLLKYALIIVSSVPILCFYPLIQRYFIQGVMIGSLKG
ncbi:MAG: carbohydrate ABC transporter permease [Christensenellales bacterium]|jgi:putative aldouronate transport system permease protein